MPPLDGQETHAEKMNVTVDTLTEFYARYQGLPSHFGTARRPGSKPVVFLPAPGPPKPAVSGNQRGHDPDDCDPSCSLYGLTRNDCGSGRSALLQSFWARPSDDCAPSR